MQLLEYRKLFVVLDAFGDDAQVEALGECDDRGHDRGVVLFCADRAYEGLVDFEDVDREGAQVGERRVASPEVIEGQVETEASQLAKERLCADRVVDEGALGEFERELGRVETGALECAGHDVEDVSGEELPGRDVDADAEALIRPAPSPRGGVATRFFEDPRADVDDQSGFFCDGDELVRSDETEARAFPSQQRLEASDRAGVGRDERLTEEPQLVARERLAQCGFEGDLARDPLLHRLVEQFATTPPVVLGPVHRDICVRQDRIGGLGAVGGEGHADARTDVGVVVAEAERGLEGGDDAFREVGRVMYTVDVFA